MATIVEGNPKAPFSIATTPRCRGGRYSFPGLLYFTLDPYLIMLSVKQGVIKYHFLSLWYDSTWDYFSLYIYISLSLSLYLYIYIYIYISLSLYFSLSLSLTHTHTRTRVRAHTCISYLHTCMNLLYPRSYGLNSNSTLLQEW